MTALASAQDGLQERILHDTAAIFPRVRGADAGQRLRIYADAWRLRLVEILGNDFPATRDALGENAFATFAERYLRAHPSAQPSVRHLGAAFADWLRLQADAPAALHELARFEWRQAAAFDAEDAPTLAIDTVAALAPEAWPGMRLHLHPATQLLDTERLTFVRGAATLGGTDSPVRWLLWRDADGDVRWRSLEDDEADALRGLSIGSRFADLCDRLAIHHGDDAALRAASLLKRWLVDGLLAAAPTDPD